MIIAVDGPAGAGKGTLAQMLAKKYHLAFIETGLSFRATAYKLVENNVSLEDQDAAAQAAHQLKLEDLTDVVHLRSEEIGNAASIISVYPPVRQAILEFLRELAHHAPKGFSGAILDGRDVGTVICPEADVKFYVTASEEVRAKRRSKELQDRGIQSIYTQILQGIIERDERDSSRANSPMKPAEDAIIIDSSHKTPQEMVDLASRYIDQLLERQNAQAP
jgi:cytidylate kinase